MLAISATFSALLLAAGAGRTSSPHAWRTSGRAYLCSTYTQADFSVLFFFLLVHTALSVRCLAAALCNFCALPFMYDAHDAVADVGCATRRRYLWRNHSNVNAAHLAHKGVLSSVATGVSAPSSSVTCLRAASATRRSASVSCCRSRCLPGLCCSSARQGHQDY